MQKSLSRTSLIVLFCGLAICVKAQSLENDFIALRQKTIGIQLEIEAGHQNPDFLLQDHPSALKRYNPATLLFGSLLWLYETSISPHISSVCFYTPTSSAYSKNLIFEYGLIPGIVCTADRLTRCNKLAHYDYPKSEFDPKTNRINEDVSYYKFIK